MNQQQLGRDTAGNRYWPSCQLSFHLPIDHVEVDHNGAVVAARRSSSGMMVNGQLAVGATVMQGHAAPPNPAVLTHPESPLPCRITATQSRPAFQHSLDSGLDGCLVGSNCHVASDAQRSRHGRVAGLWLLANAVCACVPAAWKRRAGGSWLRAATRRGKRACPCTLCLPRCTACTAVLPHCSSLALTCSLPPWWRGSPPRRTAHRWSSRRCSRRCRSPEQS